MGESFNEGLDGTTIHDPIIVGGSIDDTPIGQTTPAAGSFTQLKWAKGADVASANAMVLGADGNYFDITGTTTINSIGTLGIGSFVILHFDGALTLTHHNTNLILPGGEDILTAAGEEALFVEYASGDWRCVCFGNVLALSNDRWIFAANYAGSDIVNMFKVNVDDEIDVGGTLVLGGSIEAAEDAGAITTFDMPVSDAPTAGAEMSETRKLCGNNVLTIGANADSAGGVTGEFVKMHGAQMVHKTDAGAANYAPSALTSDYVITVDNSAAVRAVTISEEDRDSGSPTKPRIFIIKNISAGTNNITISLETSGTIDGAATKVISTAYGVVRLLVDGTNAYTF